MRNHRVPVPYQVEKQPAGFSIIDQKPNTRENAKSGLEEQKILRESGNVYRYSVFSSMAFLSSRILGTGTYTASTGFAWSQGV